VSVKLRYFKLSIMALFCSITLAMAASGQSRPAKSKQATAPASANINVPTQIKPMLDTIKVRKLYMDGDFDEAIALLEKSMAENKEYSHSDSIFFCKHLGVMYAAKYETREKGKYYMYMLLKVEPTARILDMYASDMIYMIFKNIQDEFDATRIRLGRAERNLKGMQGDSMPAPKSSEPLATKEKASKPAKSHTLLWVGTGTVVAAAGVAAYFLMSEDPQPKQVEARF
jgi:hypothetical protein